MDSLWLLKGTYEAPGWGSLEKDAREDKLDVVLYDRDAWALVRAPAAPTQYEGFSAAPPPSGLYLDAQGRPAYVANGVLVAGPREVLAVLGDEAAALMARLGDPDLVLDRLGRAY